MTFLEVGRLVKAGSSKRLCSIKLGRRNFRQDKHILGKISLTFILLQAFTIQNLYLKG